MPIRPATAAELPALQDIERAAGEAFRALGMDAVADDEPPTIAELERFRRVGGAWVAADETGAPLAYLLSEPLYEATTATATATASRCEHIEQITVHPRAARRGIGRALIDHLADRTLAQGGTALTLTTFADVPWNAPYYARIGFRPLTEAELTPALRRIRAQEAELGLDRWPRLCMRRALAPRTAP
ncbi:GNAT family N-acetyltransferase [Streptomyces sp. G44]|uniref:GNAT family N-acetyltransferase n=1 Tax=Streptomyces sp. G44 TaxID=2807632 RepID=UPI0019618887|nr:GNAT family N-acetyltransferase [Streptomyces sp. G44]MBM7173102.1 GNAT family N-acetyltransferase [Streptomyces sp. G44]